MFKFITTIIVVVITAGYLLTQSSEVKEFTLKIEKYAHINIGQNQGLHKFALQTIKKVVGLFPSFKTYDRFTDEGIGSHKSINFSSNT